MSQRPTTHSPGQIRRQAALAFRNRVRAHVPDRVPMLRLPDPGETPLSVHEIAVGVEAGVIQASHARATSQGVGA